MTTKSQVARSLAAGCAVSFFFLTFAVHAQNTPTLGEVLVLDTPLTQDVRNFSPRTTVILAEEIRQLGATSVNEAILRSIGAFSKLNLTGAQDRLIDLRGFGETSASNLVVLVDGVRQNEGDMDGNNLSWIPIEAVQAIEITRGGSSVMYGEGATGGVINILTADSANSVAVGKVLCASDVVRHISFTGSTEVGRILMAQSAPTIKKLALELGGHAPFIVFEDADIDAAVEGALISKYRNAGQTCVCTNRFYVHDKVYDEFVNKLSSGAAKIKVGNGFEQGVQQGQVRSAGLPGASRAPLRSRCASSRRRRRV